MSYWEDELDDVLDESVNEGHDVDYPKNEDRRSGEDRRIVQWTHFCPHCQEFLTESEVRVEDRTEMHLHCKKPVLEFDDGSQPYTVRSSKDRREA